MKIAITGASGLIGNELVFQISKSKSCRVIAIDCNAPDNSKSVQSNVERICSDFSEKYVHNKIVDFNPDILVHCAAHPGGKSLKEPLKNIEINVSKTFELFLLCALNKINIIFLSSSVIYHSQDNNSLNEISEVFPQTIYGVNKVACEYYLKILEKTYGLKWNVLRLFATYGAGHKPNNFQGIVNVLLTQMMNGNQVLVKGSLQRSRDLLHVSDAADAIIRTIRKKSIFGEIINIGTGNPISIEDLIKKISKSLNKSFEKYQIIQAEGTVGDVFYNSSDCSKAKSLLGFEAKVSLQEGLSMMIEARALSNHKSTTNITEG